MRCALLTGIVVLALVVPVAAQQLSPVGTYTTEWAELQVYIGPDLTNGTRTIEVRALDQTDPSGPAWELRDLGTGRSVCAVWKDSDGINAEVQCDYGIGTLTWYPYPTSTGELAIVSFHMELEGLSGHAYERFWEVGKKQTTPPPPATQGVAFTNVTNGQTVSRTIGMRLSASGLGTAAYKWYTSIDARQISYRIESSTAITLWWNTTAVANGAHTVSVRVVDAAGKVARGSVSVLVRN